MLEATALVAAQTLAHGTALDVDVMPSIRVVGRGLHHASNVVELEPARHHALVVHRINATQLQIAGLARSVDGLGGVAADDLDELADGRRMDLRVHVIFPPNL